jgi:predicted O-linked N-acetylglucosamine transferase (SPINDLY family)
MTQVVCPSSSRHCYGEAVARLPHSYFVNDYRQAHRDVLEGVDRRAEREALGLPADAFVFYCANQVWVWVWGGWVGV